MTCTTIPDNLLPRADRLADAGPAFAWNLVASAAASVPGMPAGEGVQTSWIHTWPLPPWVTVLLVLAAVALVVALYLKEQTHVGRLYLASLVGLRVLLVLLVVAMLYGWMRHRHLTDLPDLVLAVDTSASMAHRDHYSDPAIAAAVERAAERAGLGDEPSRLDVVREYFLGDGARNLTLLEQRYNVKLYSVGEAVQLRSADGQSPERALRELEAVEPASRLGRGLREILDGQRGRPTAGVVYLTDGVTTDGQPISEIAQYARRVQTPLFLVGLGDEQAPPDVRLGDLLVDDLAFVGDVVNFDFNLTATGYEGQRASVRLRRAGYEAPFAQRSITLAADGVAQPVRLAHRPYEEGDWEYVVEVEPLEGEVNLDNNRLAQVVTVRDETIRVLLVQEYPSMEFRFLKMLLERALKRSGEGRAVELTTVLQESDLEFAAQDATAQRVFPVRRDELFQYDVVIFGDVNPAFLSQSVMENLVAFVTERGGGLMVLAGPRHTPLAFRDTPLASLLPVRLGTATAPDAQSPLESAYPVMPTPLGLATPPMQLGDSPDDSSQLWQQLPGIYWWLATPDLRPGARVLAVHPTRSGPAGQPLPLVSLQFVGAGQVVFHATDESWRWARVGDSSLPHERYWMQWIRYLSRAKLLSRAQGAELTSDRERYDRGEPVRLRARFFDERAAPAADDGVTVMLEHDGGRRRHVVLRRDGVQRGVFQGLVSDLADGQYRAWVASPTTDGPPPSLRFSVVAPPGEQARLEMDATDLKRAAEVSQGQFYTAATLDRLLDELPRGRHVRIESLPPEPIWNSSWIAALFVAMLAAEWWLRKRAGML